MTQPSTRKFKIGQLVVFNGRFPGVVTRYYYDMIEVRGDRGDVCIAESEATADTSSLPAWMVKLYSRI